MDWISDEGWPASQLCRLSSYTAHPAAHRRELNGREEWQQLVSDEGDGPILVSDGPSALHLMDPFIRTSLLDGVTSQLPSFELHERGSATDPQHEWKKFLTYLFAESRVARVFLSGWELLLQPPKYAPVGIESIQVKYRPSSASPFVYTRPSQPPSLYIPSESHIQLLRSPTPLDPSRFTTVGVYTHTNPLQPAAQVFSQDVKVGEIKERVDLRENVARVHPRFLNSLELTHTDWAFGGIAELIDNARDAGATRLDLSIEEMRWKALQKTIPVMQVTDNGYGMDHADIVRMLSFGHDSPDEDDATQIGRFGVGFKTGTMRVADDVLVLTQSQTTRSIGFLSKSYNKGRDELVVPIVTYRNYEGSMELDTTLQSESDEEASFKAVETHSPFNKFRIGSEFDRIGTGKTGTRIFVYNLKPWGSKPCMFLWESRDREGEAGGRKGDIIIQSKRIRMRSGQTSTSVPLDYSLRAYVEVMFLVPNMSIYVQGSRVRTVKLADDLHQTKRYRGSVLGKRVVLTLGFRQIEFDRVNCGIFMYWHKRLIKAYERVGRMLHSADYGRGVIGVIDITELMDFGKGEVGVLANKQGFKDCEQYVLLEAWLADKVHEYCDDKDNLEVLNPKEIGKGVKLVPDQDWVQCDKCLSWRILPVGVAVNDLPSEWFCYMEPFKGKCEMPQDKVEPGVVTVGVKRRQNGEALQPVNCSDQSGVAYTADDASEESSRSIKNKNPVSVSKDLRLQVRQETIKEPIKGPVKGPVNDPVKAPATKDSQKEEVSFAKVVTRSKFGGSSIPASRGPSSDLVKDDLEPPRLKRLKKVRKNF